MVESHRTQIQHLDWVVMVAVLVVAAVAAVGQLEMVGTEAVLLGALEELVLFQI
jgi:hypothetical protein